MAMTKTEMRRNNSNLRLALILLSVLAISCTAIREFSDRPSEKVQKLNESVPAGVGTAEKDHRIHDLDSFKIVLPEPGEILLGDADAQPTDLASLGPLLQPIAETTGPDRPVVNLTAAAQPPTTDAAAIMDGAREPDP